MRRASLESSGSWRRRALQGKWWTGSGRGSPPRSRGRAGCCRTIVFRFGRLCLSRSPCCLRLAAGERFPQRRGLQPSQRRRPYLACRDDPGTGRSSRHVLFNGRQSNRHRSRRAWLVSIPPNHKQGEIEWATTPPWASPNVDYVSLRRKIPPDFGDKAFVQALNAQLAQRPPGKRKVFLFIHGFNTMFAEGLYRLAQLAHDAKAPGVGVLFTWASRGKPTAYVYDLNSATAARDGLEHTLRLLLSSNAEEVNVLAHSMGNWVTVEAFRQIKDFGRPQSREQDRLRISRGARYRY